MAVVMAKTTLTLLGPAWTRAFRCVWMLEELHLKNYTVDDSAMPVSTRVRQFVSTGKVPVLLEFDDASAAADADTTATVQPSFVLSESSAINTYLADTYGEPGSARLVPPAGTRDRARYDEAVSCIVTELDAQGLWIHRKHETMAKQCGAIPDAVAHARTQFDRVNQHLAGQLKPYLLGEGFSAADILYVHCLDWSKGIGWHADWPPSVVSYRQLCHDRPAYQRAVVLRDTNKPKRAAIPQSNPSGETSTTTNPSSQL